MAALMNQTMLIVSHLSPSSSSSSHHRLLPRLCSFSSPKPATFLKAAPHRICRAMGTDQGQVVSERKIIYYPGVWDYNKMASLTNGFEGKEYREELEKMKEEVKALIKDNHDEDPLVKLELIDDVQQLGLHYHFQEEIEDALGVIHKSEEDSRWSGDLYATALRFRLLRQNLFKAPQDVFRSFLDEAGNFRESLREDAEGLLSLYEASFLGWKGETIIDKAMEFSGSCFKDMEKDKLPEWLAVRVDRALDVPMHWRTGRLQARWFMDVYKEEPGMNPKLLKLAKLDFNIVQSIHMKEIGKLTRWWVESGLTKMNFSRDALLENYLFSAMTLFEPKYGAFRVINSKIAVMIILIDDIYDAYGTLEELELLTEFINRWDINGIDKLPNTMKTCFTALYNTTNEIGLWSMIEHGFNFIPELQKAWEDFCKGHLVEGKWYHNGSNSTLTLKEYLDTATVTVGGVIMLKWCYMATLDKVSAETLDATSETPRILFSSSLILRLVNDFATSLFGRRKGDNLKAVECYMNETGEESEDVARDHIKYLIRETWKTMNEDMFDHDPLSRTFADACLDHARASQYFYQFGCGNVDDMIKKTQKDLISLLVEPVPTD